MSFAEYPRPSGPAVPRGRGPGVYFEAIGEAWGLIVKDLGHWVAATIVYFAVGYALSRPGVMIVERVMPSSSRDPRFWERFIAVLPVQFGVALITTPVSYILFVGMVGMGVRKSRGEYINVSMMFEPFRRFGRVYAANLLFLVVALASMAPLLLPALFFVPVLMLMPTVAYLRDLGPLDALAATFDACKSHGLGLLGLSIVLAAILFLGCIPCFTGLLVAFPVVAVVLAIHYRAFFEAPEAM